ncbi:MULTISPECIES: RraA family protein [unclassified Herbaspirillum]|uniref:RraA family protein n=1 Tax=unclassified Herbaspirillum TaxID=2624150 RepID=UPI001151D656|nr:MULTISPECIES: RraA family protein [unclassified Herbaspirillum]MBB5393894.1 RraA family protein [Herbaspirillum sp. SJZ102]TQK00068.1 RraA family protein [Herbaspirillum sp. SJZ130]TQK04607.1 RraA family protein [Herbaspirillum sp. SJZ106]TWC65092.1 RraA family protein [Herbaspirillum sp. SJZ099]
MATTVPVSALPFQINPVAAPAPADIVAALQDIVVSHLSDNLQRLSGMGGLRRIHGDKKLVGTAVTVKTRPGDNLLIYKALMMMQPGHVLVVDGGGETSNALVGELIMLYAQQRGCAGFVLDSAVRDTAAFLEADFPCYARAVSHRGPYKNGPGHINVPVTIGGQVVNPGDIVVGDEDGLVCFPQAQAESLIDAARKTQAYEEAIKAEIANGRVEQEWLARVLTPFGL